MNKLCGWVALSIVLAIGAGTKAQSGNQAADKKAEASAHFKRGVVLFQEDAFRAALAEFEHAYEVAPDYRLLYNIAQSKLRIQDYLGAVQSFEKYLMTGGSDISAERRTHVEQSLVSLRERIGRIGVTCNRDGAEIFIDDVSVGKTPLATTVPVNLGHHRVFVRTEDGASDTQQVRIASGEVAEVTFELEAPRPTLAVEDRPEDNTWSSRKRAAVATWATGALLLAGAGATGVLAMSAQDEMDGMLETEGVSPSSVNDKRDLLKTLALTTDVLIGAGAAAALVGTVLWWIDRRAHKKDEMAPAAGTLAGLKLRVRLTHNGAQLHGAF